MFFFEPPIFPLLLVMINRFRFISNRVVSPAQLPLLIFLVPCQRHVNQQPRYKVADVLCPLPTLRFCYSRTPTGLVHFSRAMMSNAHIRLLCYSLHASIARSLHTENHNHPMSSSTVISRCVQPPRVIPLLAHPPCLPSSPITT